MNRIERALADYFHEPLLGYEDFAREHSALPLYRGWSGTTFLTASGSFLFLDEETPAPTIRPETDEHSQIMSLVAGVENFPALANLLPARSTEAENCETCGGNGKLPIGSGSIFCGGCSGVGWLGRLGRAGWAARPSR